jgi:hypothetical protein
VSRTGLQWCVEWCYALNSRQEYEHISDVLKSADQFVRRLIPLCVKGRGHKPENQLLSKYFMFRGFVAWTFTERSRGYDEALEWNPQNENARTLRDKLRITALVDDLLAATGSKPGNERTRGNL